MTQIDGKWKCKVASPMGDQEFVLTVVRDGNRFSGSAEGGIGGKEIDDGIVEGETLRWTMRISKPMPLTLACRVEVTGDTLDGSVKAGFLGSYPIRGTRA